MRLRLPVDPFDDRPGCRLAWWAAFGTGGCSSTIPGKDCPTARAPPPPSLSTTQKWSFQLRPGNEAPVH